MLMKNRKNMSALRSTETIKINARILSLLLVVVTIISTTQFAAAAAPTPVSYAAVFNATYYADHYADLKAAYGNNETKLFQHFINSGMKEGRQASEEFNVQAYKARYGDLRAAYGNNLVLYYQHYISNGKAEGRNGRVDGNAGSGNSSSQNTANTSTQNRIPLGTEKIMGGFTYVVKGYTSQGVALYAQKGDGDFYTFEICPHVTRYIEEIGITNAMSEKEKADTIAMYVANHIKYGYCTTTPLHCGKAVCMDYGSVFYGFCRLFGIEAYEVISCEINHEWNVVIIDGVEYYYDTTWISNYIEYGSNDYGHWCGTTINVFNKDGKHTASDILRRGGIQSDDMTEIFEQVYLNTGFHRCPYLRYDFY